MSDAGRPVRAGEDRHPRRHGPRPAAGRLDRPHDPRHRRRAQRRASTTARSRSSPSTRAACRARITARCSAGYLKLVEAGLRRHRRPDDLRQRDGKLRELDQRDRRRLPVHGPVRCASSASTASPSRTATSRPRRTMGANWCRQNGHTKVGFFWERGSSGEDYANYFRVGCQNAGVEILREVSLGPNPRGLEESLRSMREQGAEAIVYMGYGYSTFQLRPRVQGHGLGSAALHGHRVHVLFELQRLGRGPRGLARGRSARRGRHEPQLRGDARALRQALRAHLAQRRRRARPTTPPGRRSSASPTRRIATPPEVKLGLERIKWMPCTNGGPATYLTFAAYDHRGYKGDFLTIRELRGGELHFRGYYRPQWPSNTDSPLLGELTQGSRRHGQARRQGCVHHRGGPGSGS